MADLATQQPPVPEQSDAGRAPRWPASICFLTAWLLPATTARRTQHVTLPKAWAIHVVALLLAAPLIPLQALPISCAFIGVLGGITGIFSSVPNPGHPITVAVFVVWACIRIEVGFLIVAFLVMPWGAQDERLRTSFAHALRHTWLHTTHAIPAVLLVSLLFAGVQRATRNWEAGHPSPPVWSPSTQLAMPAPPLSLYSASPDPQDWEKYRAALGLYNAQRSAQTEAQLDNMHQWDVYRRSRPWYILHYYHLMQLAWLVAGAWVAWALLCAVGPPRPAQPIIRPPLCERCGYNLSTIPMDSRCPECGEPVIQSLGPDVRPGTPWDRRRDAGRLRAWLQCSLGILLRPRKFGRQIRVCTPVTGHRWLPAACLVPIFLIGLASAGGEYWIGMDYDSPRDRDHALVWIHAPLVSLQVVALALMLTLASAGLVGIGVSLSRERNALPAAMQGAAYLTAYLLLAVFCCALLHAFVHYLKRETWFNALEVLWGPSAGAIAFCTWFLPSAGMLLLYLALLGKATAAAGYANK